MEKESEQYKYFQALKGLMDAEDGSSLADTINSGKLYIQSAFVGAVLDGDVVVAERILSISKDIIVDCIDEVTEHLFSDNKMYLLFAQNGLEDLIYANIYDIQDKVLVALGAGNSLPLEYAINNCHELDFDIDGEIKNRGWIEIALWYNLPDAVKVLLKNDILVSDEASNYAKAWLRDNSIFINNPMHSHSKDLEWKNNFYEIIKTLAEHGWKDISGVAKKINGMDGYVLHELAFLIKEDGDVSAVVNGLRKLSALKLREVLSHFAKK